MLVLLAALRVVVLTLELLVLVLVLVLLLLLPLPPVLMVMVGELMQITPQFAKWLLCCEPKHVSRYQLPVLLTSTLHPANSVVASMPA